MAKHKLVIKFCEWDQENLKALWKHGTIWYHFLRTLYFHVTSRIPVTVYKSELKQQQWQPWRWIKIRALASLSHQNTLEDSSVVVIEVGIFHYYFSHCEEGEEVQTDSLRTRRTTWGHHLKEWWSLSTDRTGMSETDCIYSLSPLPPYLQFMIKAKLKEPSMGLQACWLSQCTRGTKNSDYIPKHTNV